MKQVLTNMTTILICTLSLFVSICVPVNASCQPMGNNQGVITKDQLGNLPEVGCDNTTDSSWLQGLTSFTFGALAVISVVFVVIGGLRYALSGGDANAVASAKKTITYALLGLVLGVSVFVITNFIFSKIVKI